MCLAAKQTKREFLRRTKIQTHKNNEDVVVGWKVVNIPKSGNIYPPYYRVTRKTFKTKTQLYELHFRQKDHSTQEWLTDDSGKKYRMGFHTIANYDEALGYLRGIETEESYRKFYLIKVHISKYDITSYGTQCGCGALVSDTMYIPKQHPITSKGNMSKRKI